MEYQKTNILVVVPRWFLVWYNREVLAVVRRIVVVPRWFLVWYNFISAHTIDDNVVVPRWFLVWYNRPLQKALKAWL